jgi:hypothetical protein
MAEDIVACSGCGKKFRIPDGSPPSGSFACTACGADVAWGRAAAAGGGGAKARGGRAAATRGGGGKAPKTGKASSRGARRAKGRRAREGGDGDGEGGGRRGGVPKEKENKTLPLIAALMGAVLLIGALIIAFTGEEPNYEEQAAGLSTNTPAPGTSTDPGDTGTPDTTAPDAGTETPTAPENAGGSAPETPLFPVEPDDGDDEESGIGGSESSAGRQKDYRYWFLRPMDELFTEVEPVEGTTPEESDKLRQLAALATDFDAGSEGMSAERELAKAGRKAMPFLISQFAKAWNGSKWQEPNEQFACFKIQQLSREIVKATRLPSDLFVRFPPGPGAGPDQYKRAARMWTAWWRGEGQYIEEFQAFEDEE